MVQKSSDDEACSSLSSSTNSFEGAAHTNSTISRRSSLKLPKISIDLSSLYVEDPKSNIKGKINY